jgi:hypothetical protein
MDTSRDRAAGVEGDASIRLRYSRQFQQSGHSHTIDAEATLPIGASQEVREQVIRELEAEVDLLARQIVQRASRSFDERRAQSISRPSAPGPAPTPQPNRSAEPVSAAQSATRVPVSETMPAVPAPAGERTIRLADFINAIKRHWDMSPQEAMRLLKVKSLDGLNYREAYNSLKTMVEAEGRSARTPGSQTQPAPSRPVVEAPRQGSRSGSSAPDARPPTNQATSSPGVHTQGSTALREGTRSAPPTLPTATPLAESAPTNDRRREPQAGVDFAGSPKAPIPIQIGVVRDVSARAPYKFEEEDEPDLSDDEDFAPPAERSAASLQAQSKLDELKKIRGNSMASAPRLNVLHNVIGDQISGEELQRLVQGVWGINSLKKLKNEQVEKLISWAKEDYFADEARDLLDLLSQAEEE